MPEAATWVLDILTATLIVVAILALSANRKSAQASEESSKAARDLFTVQQDEYKRREAGERPNLQLYNAYLVKPQQVSGPSTYLHNLPIHIEVMNFGQRPAKVTVARLEVAGKQFDADQRTTTCARRHEIVRFVVDRAGHLDIREPFIEAMTGLKPQLQGGGERFLQRAGNPENISDEYRKVTLTLTYSETDGSRVRTEQLTFDVPTYRGDWSRKPLTMRVLHDPEEAGEGDLPH
jgi:hypothetical protein